VRKLPEFQKERLASDDWLQFRSLETLPAVAGVPKSLLVRLALKEATDNALDSVEQETRRPGGDLVRIDEDDGAYVISADEGPGLDPAEVPELFSMRRPRSSSRRWRLPFRGMLGNGLRVLVGLVYASGPGAELGVETRGRRLTLAPQPDGSTKVLADEPSEIEVGTVLRVRFGELVDGDDDAMLWAEQAIDYSSTGAVYHGLPSPHWFDASTWVDLLAMVDRPLREVVAGFDGCSGPNAGRIVEMLGLKGRKASSLSSGEAVLVLDAMRDKADPVKPRRLGSIGRRDFDLPGYARVEGTIITGSKPPNATIPYVVEVWVGQTDKMNGQGEVDPLLVNRSPVANHPMTFAPRTWEKGASLLSGCGVGTRIDTPGRGTYTVAIAITTPHMPISTSGKQPLLSDFARSIHDATEKAIRGARRAWVQSGNRQEAEPGAPKPEKPARLSHKFAVLKVLDEAVRFQREGGHRFRQRNLFYTVRRMVGVLIAGEELTYKNFCGIITDYENENGPIEDMVRDARGVLILPHGRGKIELGTVEVEEFLRPPWLFNKLLFVEKEGLADVLHHAGWLDRHDCAVIGGKGFTTRAIKDLVDKLAETDEPIEVFTLHDADAHGTTIYETFQEETKARGARKIKIIDLGLHPWQALKMKLEIETFERGKKRRPVAEYVRRRRGKAPGGSIWEEWLQTHRIELDAMRSVELIQFLDNAMAKYAGKVIPPDDVTLPQIEEKVRSSIETWAGQNLARDLAAAISRREQRVYAARQALERQLAQQVRNLEDLRQRRGETVAAAVAEIMDKLALPDAAQMIEAVLDQEPEALWSEKIEGIAAEIWNGIKP
jgi:DNA topoisomerase 6 subunit A-like protein